MYRKLTAERIFDGYDWLREGSMLIVDDKGAIADIESTFGVDEDAEYFEGILAPGMINAHCHLELSHLKGAIQEKTGLIEFLCSVIKSRATDPAWVMECMESAEKEMYDNGIVAVIDICNTAASATLKHKSPIHWHSLIEVINLSDINLQNKWPLYDEILKGFLNDERTNDYANLTPHAPYSVSNQTHKAINDTTTDLLLSIHNQETDAENDLFKYGRGGFLKFYNELGVPIPSFIGSSKRSLQTYLPYYTNGQTLILVHNNVIEEEDILFAKRHADQYGLTIFYCLCPNANLYIEDRLPPVELLLKHNCPILLGTDSYASNKRLSIASEIQTLAHEFPEVSLKELLRAATSTGAKAFGRSELGSFATGKLPGIVLIETTDGMLTGTSKRII